MLKKAIITYLIVFLLMLGLWFTVTQPVWVSNEASNEKVEMLQHYTPLKPENLRSHVVTLSETLPSRMGIEELLQPTVKWIEQELGQYGSTRRQSYQVDNETFHNIILEFGPKSEETIVIGAHYDAFDGTPGADDNASGVAGLIELARLLSQTKLDTHVELVAYTLEEPGYFDTENMGSYVHANSLKQADRKVRLMISLEMIGYFSDERHSQTFPLLGLEYIYPDQGNFIAVIANLSNISAVRDVKKSFQKDSSLPVYSFNAPAFIPGVDFSDHRNYWFMDYPAVMITDTAFNRNKAYHTEQDTADRLDYKKMALVVEGVYRVVLDQSQNKE